MTTAPPFPQTFWVQAPSNIALFKYMGKTSAKDAPFLDRNIPENPSLSLTLSGLSTWLKVELSESSEFCFRFENGLPLTDQELQKFSPGRRFFSLGGESEAAEKFARYFRDALLAWGGELPAVQASVWSANTFPKASGIASSASSFAAAARACVEICSLFGRTATLPRISLSQLARVGSGSASRSVLGPWALWEGKEAEPLAGPQRLWHSVALVASDEKKVGSSEAHRRVKSSPLWQGRPERVRQRIAKASEQMAALAASMWGASHQSAALVQAWESLSRTVFQEAWEMHSLFHTAEPPFTYFRPQTLELLEWLWPWIERGGLQAPLVTLDAGPNVHVMGLKLEKADTALAFEAEWTALCSELGIELLKDQPGHGARVLRVNSRGEWVPSAD